MIKYFMWDKLRTRLYPVTVNGQDGKVYYRDRELGRMSELEGKGHSFTPMNKRKEAEDDGFVTVHPQVNSDGGPASYYDFDKNWVTWNDLADYKAKNQWKEFSFHIGNIGKAIMRWGDKTGTSTLYDTKKIIYSALRILVMMEGKEAAANYLEKLSTDKQFRKE